MNHVKKTRSNSTGNTGRGLCPHKKAILAVGTSLCWNNLPGMWQSPHCWRFPSWNWTGLQGISPRLPPLPTKCCIFWGPSYPELFCGCIPGAQGHTHHSIFQLFFSSLSAQLCSHSCRSNAGQRRERAQEKPTEPPLVFHLLVPVGCWQSQQCPSCSFDSFDRWWVILRFQGNSLPGSRCCFVA